MAAFQYLKGPYKKDSDKVFSRACSNRTRGHGFKLKEGRFRPDIRKKFFTRGVKILERVVQRSGRCHIPGSLQGQVGRGSEQPGLVEDVPAHAGGLVWMTFKGPFQPKAFYDCMIALWIRVFWNKPAGCVCFPSVI